MTPYSSRSGKRSGVTAYEAGEDYLLVEKMKRLATASKGLSTFIARHQPAYEGKM
jgi:hypothetical protein